MYEFWLYIQSIQVNKQKKYSKPEHWNFRVIIRCDRAYDDYFGGYYVYFGVDLGAPILCSIKTLFLHDGIHRNGG